MNQPLVSVIIPTHNGARYIRKAIENVLVQDYQNIEIIAINDGSKDETPAILAEFSRKDQRIKIITNETNLGFVKTLNKGIAVSRGRYIARIDDDDIWIDRQKTKKQVEFLEKNSDYALTGGGMIKIDSNNKELSRYLFPESDKDIRKSLLINNLFAHSTIMARKDIVERAGGYDEKFGFFADMDLWLKVGRMAKFYNFQEYFIYYLDKEALGGYSMRNNDIRRKLGISIELRKKYKNDYQNFLKAYLFCIASYIYSFLPFRKKIKKMIKSAFVPR
jgi:glycosyltransferase involved in cell wall biosynthesis